MQESVKNLRLGSQRNQCAQLWELQTAGSSTDPDDRLMVSSEEKRGIEVHGTRVHGFPAYLASESGDGQLTLVPERSLLD